MILPNDELVAPGGGHDDCEFVNVSLLPSEVASVAVGGHVVAMSPVPMLCVPVPPPLTGFDVDDHVTLHGGDFLEVGNELLLGFGVFFVGNDFVGVGYEFTF